VVLVRIETGRIAGRVAVHDMLPGPPRLGRSRIDELPGPRMDAVRPDQHVPGHPAAVGELRLDTVRPDRRTGHPPPVVHPYPAFDRELLQRPVERGPGQGPGRPFDRPVPEPPAPIVGQRHRPRRVRHRFHGLGRTDHGERRHPVAHHGEKRAAVGAARGVRLEHLGFDSGVEQGERGRGPRDTTTDDNHFAYGHKRHPAVLKGCRSAPSVHPPFVRAG
jgi:hypothetical protein